MSLLFDKTFWYGILALAVVVLIIFLIFKYPQSRVYVFSLAGIVLVSATIWCSIQLDKYYNANGGILGKLSELIGINQSEKLENEAIFKLKNILLMEDEQGNYSAVISSSDKLDFENKTYTILVNDEPCSNSVFNTLPTGISVRGEYHYIFKNDDLETLAEDNLKINFSSFTNGYEIKLSTGSAESVSYWNRYFTKNGMVLSVKEFGYSQEDELDFVNGDTSNFAVATYIVEGKVYRQDVYVPGSKLKEVVPPRQADKVFECWTDKDGNVLNNKNITENMTFYARFKLADKTKLDLVFTTSHLQSIKTSGWNPATGGTALEIKEAYYSENLKEVYLYVRGVNKKGVAVYVEYKISIDNKELITADFLVEQVCIANNPLIIMNVYYSVVEYNQEYFEANKDCSYKIENEENLLKDIFVELNSTYSSSSNLTKFIYSFLVLGKDNSVVKTDRKTRVVVGREMTESQFLENLLEEIKV